MQLMGGKFSTGKMIRCASTSKRFLMVARIKKKIEDKNAQKKLEGSQRRQKANNDCEQKKQQASAENAVNLASYNSCRAAVAACPCHPEQCKWLRYQLCKNPSSIDPCPVRPPLPPSLFLHAAEISFRASLRKQARACASSVRLEGRKTPSWLSRHCLPPPEPVRLLAAAAIPKRERGRLATTSLTTRTWIPWPPVLISSGTNSTRPMHSQMQGACVRSRNWVSTPLKKATMWDVGG
jgi:hypothetical protein